MIKLSIGGKEAIITKDLTVEGDKELVNVLSLLKIESIEEETTSEIIIVDETNRNTDELAASIKETLDSLSDEDFNYIIVSNNESISFQMYDLLGLSIPDVMKYRDTVVFKIIDKKLPDYQEFKNRSFQVNDDVIVLEYNL